MKIFFLIIVYLLHNLFLQSQTFKKVEVDSISKKELEITGIIISPNYTEIKLTFHNNVKNYSFCINQSSRIIQSLKLTEENIAAYAKENYFKDKNEAKQQILLFGGKPIQMDDIVPCPKYTEMENIGSSKSFSIYYSLKLIPNTKYDLIDVIDGYSFYGIHYNTTVANNSTNNQPINEAVKAKNENLYLAHPNSTSNESSNKVIIPLKKGSGQIIEVPVELNNVLKINFIWDTGASEVQISPDVAITLIRTGSITESDWLPGKYYQFADGSKAKSYRFNLKSIKIGTLEFKNIAVSIQNSIEAPMLLGQNLLSLFGKYTIDNNKMLLEINQ